jgi:hypothetical protein
LAVVAPPVVLVLVVLVGVACWVCSAMMRLWMLAMRALTPSIPTPSTFGATGRSLSGNGN